MTNINEMTVGNAPVVVLGCGQMGGAIARGLVAHGSMLATSLYLVDVASDRVDALARELGASTGWPDEEGGRLVLVAVKPKHVRAVLHASLLRADDVLVSVAAGIPIDVLRAWAPEVAQVIRAMPNTPSLIGQGVTGIMAQGGVESPQAVAIFEAVGRVVELADESLFDALTAISGSGPAYIFEAIEAMADGGVLMGLPRELAKTLAIETIAGAAAMARDASVHTAELKDRVASPAGTTIEALRMLERGSFRHTLISAVEASAQKSKLMEALLRQKLKDKELGEV